MEPMYQMNQPGAAPCDLELDMVRQASRHDQFLIQPRIHNNDAHCMVSAFMNHEPLGE